MPAFTLPPGPYRVFLLQHRYEREDAAEADNLGQAAWEAPSGRVTATGDGSPVLGLYARGLALFFWDVPGPVRLGDTVTADFRSVGVA